jgi:hypothetical protein
LGVKTSSVETFRISNNKLLRNFFGGPLVWTFPYIFLLWRSQRTAYNQVPSQLRTHMKIAVAVGFGDAGFEPGASGQQVWWFSGGIVLGLFIKHV